MKKNNKFFHKLLVSLAIIMALTSAISMNVLAAENTTSVLDAGKSIVKQYFLWDVKQDTIDSAADMPSLVKALNDPYSAYFTKQQYSDFVGSINNTFTGIGISVDVSTDGIKIVSVYDSTPAKDAGLLPGDIITEADGHALAGLSTEAATSYIRGMADTTVHLQIKRDAAILSFDVTRKSIVLPTVTGTLLDKHIGYIKLSSFGDNTTTEFKNVYESLKNNSADSYIVDLRNNGGGYMNTAFDLAGYFIGNNIVLKSQNKAGAATVYNATDEKEVIDKPVIFLINGYSASASEILSAAVKDYKKAFFIGDKTYGKGVAQSIFMLPDNSYLKLTIMKFVSPLGKEINKVGISPDLEIKDDAKLGIDSLSAARILLSSANGNAGKTGLIQLNYSGQNFQVDLDVAKDKDNINTFKYMDPKLFEVDTTVPVNSAALVASSNQVVKKQLPDTGTLFDLSFYFCMGSSLIAAGVLIIKRN